MEPSVFASFAGSGILESTPGVIAGIIANATTEELSWRPEGERWSIEMVVAHLNDVEVKGFMRRFRALSEEDDPFLPVYDQNVFFQTSRHFDARRDLESFTRSRRQTIELLRNLPASSLDRRGRHEELRAGISFGELLNELAFHDLGHIRQVAELYRAVALYPKMGAFREYYRVNP